MIEFAPRPALGRHYGHDRRVRLSDAGPDGVLRLDGVARICRTPPPMTGPIPDWTDRDTWVVRRTAVRVADGAKLARSG